MRNHVSSIPDDEHVSNISLSEPGWQHSGVDTRDEDCGGVGVVPDPLEVLEHVPLPVRPVPHDAMQNVLDTLGYLHRHLFISVGFIYKSLYHFYIKLKSFMLHKTRRRG